MKLIISKASIKTFTRVRTKTYSRCTTRSPLIFIRILTYDFVYTLTGTQKAYDELAELFPQARILRMDVDTTRKKGSHQALLDQFGQWQAV